MIGAGVSIVFAVMTIGIASTYSRHLINWSFSTTGSMFFSGTLFLIGCLMYVIEKNRAKSHSSEDDRSDPADAKP
ncbi:hypothetical protein LX82_03144 [Celeribacter halophilus]|uniref:Uncharacterized protein n=2 Tax=Celeribacter halophilus TaxID=576117 RepID=A0A1I3VVX9_9RHOB|nr:hypothetical protein LX82_03144 [Celeribacter halophilus]SFJ98477.1 hypothetical protein SAMN04488138_11770 [Celeribacter halophilus]